MDLVQQDLQAGNNGNPSVFSSITSAGGGGAGGFGTRGSGDTRLWSWC